MSSSSSLPRSGASRDEEGSSDESEFIGTRLYDDSDSHSSDGETSNSFRKSASTRPGRENRFVPAHRQMVYDEEGRRRFHGAFTGGFSAGYFNSVGSAEGWTPREFRSSRNQRSDYATQSVEDFMDEEDREALGLGRYLVAREQFRSGSERDPNAMGHSRDENEQKKSLDNDTSQRMLQSVASILRPPLSSMGTQLMRLMGWRPGEGIGSSRRKEAIRLRRLRLAAKKHRHDSERDAERDSARVSSEVFCSVDEGDESDGSLSSEDAREDIEVLFAQGRDNRRGLGYDLHLVAPDVATARDRAFGSEVNSRSTRITIEQMLRNGKTGTAGFGIGAMEEDDEGEFGQVYSSVDMSTYSPDSDNEEDIYTGGTVDGKQSHPRLLALTGPVQLDRGDGRRCHDGRFPILGFRLASRPDVQSKHFSPPNVPSKFDLFHRFTKDLEEVLPYRLPESSSLVLTRSGPRSVRKRLSVKEREATMKDLNATMVGSLDSQSQSHSQQAEERGRRERVSHLRRVKALSKSDVTYGKKENSQADSSSLASSSVSEDKLSNVELDRIKLYVSQSDVERDSQGSFRYRSDPQKQERYLCFLRRRMLTESIDSSFVERIYQGMTEWERQHEEEEFSRIVRLFKPLEAPLAKKFVSGGVTLGDKSEIPNSRSQVDSLRPPCPRQFVNNRRKEAFCPLVLLCSRFGVNPPPNAIKSTSSLDTKKSTSELTVDPARVAAQSFLSSIFSGSKDQDLEEEEDELEDEEEEEEEEEKNANQFQEVRLSLLDKSSKSKGDMAEPLSRPPLDLFKAIFSDSESESDSESKPESEEVTETESRDASSPSTILLPAVNALPPTRVDEPKIERRPLRSLSPRVHGDSSGDETSSAHSLNVTAREGLPLSSSDVNMEPKRSLASIFSSDDSNSKSLSIFPDRPKQPSVRAVFGSDLGPELEGLFESYHETKVLPISHSLSTTPSVLEKGKFDENASKHDVSDSRMTSSLRDTTFPPHLRGSLASRFSEIVGTLQFFGLKIEDDGALMRVLSSSSSFDDKPVRKFFQSLFRNNSEDSVYEYCTSMKSYLRNQRVWVSSPESLQSDSSTSPDEISSSPGSSHHRHRKHRKHKKKHGTEAKTNTTLEPSQHHAKSRGTREVNRDEDEMSSSPRRKHRHRHHRRRSPSPTSKKRSKHSRSHS